MIEYVGPVVAIAKQHKMQIEQLNATSKTELELTIQDLGDVVLVRESGKLQLQLSDTIIKDRVQLAFLTDLVTLK